MQGQQSTKWKTVWYGGKGKMDKMTGRSMFDPYYSRIQGLLFEGHTIKEAFDYVCKYFELYTSYSNFWRYVKARRLGELVEINQEDVDWRTGDILICGEKGGRYRTIYLDDVARYHIKKYLDSRRDRKEALFVGVREPFLRLSTDGIRAVLKVIAERQHLTCRVYPHKLRKTLGMQLKNQGVDLGTVQEILGHASPEVTARYYAESTPDTLRSVRKRIA